MHDCTSRSSGARALGTALSRLERCVAAAGRARAAPGAQVLAGGLFQLVFLPARTRVRRVPHRAARHLAQLEARRSVRVACRARRGVVGRHVANSCIDRRAHKQRYSVSRGPAAAATAPPRLLRTLLHVPAARPHRGRQRATARSSATMRLLAAVFVVVVALPAARAYSEPLGSDDYVNACPLCDFQLSPYYPVIRSLSDCLAREYLPSEFHSTWFDPPTATTGQLYWRGPCFNSETGARLADSSWPPPQVFLSHNCVHSSTGTNFLPQRLERVGVCQSEFFVLFLGLSNGLFAACPAGKYSGVWAASFEYTRYIDCPFTSYNDICRDWDDACHERNTIPCNFRRFFGCENYCPGCSCGDHVHFNSQGVGPTGCFGLSACLHCT